MVGLHLPQLLDWIGDHVVCDLVMLVAHQHEVRERAPVLITHRGIKALALLLRRLDMAELANEHAVRIHHQSTQPGKAQRLPDLRNSSRNVSPTGVSHFGFSVIEGLPAPAILPGRFRESPRTIGGVRSP